MDLERIGKNRKRVVISNERNKDWEQEVTEYVEGKVDMEHTRGGESSGVHGKGV